MWQLRTKFSVGLSSVDIRSFKKKSRALTISKTHAQRHFLCNFKQIRRSEVKGRQENRYKLTNILSNVELECFAITHYKNTHFYDFKAIL